MKEGREKLAFEGCFTSTASRFRASKVEAGSPSFEVEGQKEDLPPSRSWRRTGMPKWKEEGEGWLLKVDLPVRQVDPGIRT